MSDNFDHQNWLQTFQALLHYYLPPLENSPTVNLCSIAAVVVGLILVFRSAKFERAVVACFSLGVGAWVGYRISQVVQTPAPISAAVGGVLLTILAYRTYKLWLAGGSVVILFLLAMLFQVGRGITEWNIPGLNDAATASREPAVSLPTAEEQLRNLYPAGSDQLAKIGEQVAEQLKTLGPRGWLLPALAAVVGGVLAYWALRVFAVVWLGFIGAVTTILGASAFACAHWPPVRTNLIASPQILAAAALALWLLGLIAQAREARFPTPKPAPSKAPAKA